MSSGFKAATLLALAAYALGAADLRVCAEAKNLPFSNSQGQGFENKIAQIVGHDLGRRIQYFWALQPRKFARATFSFRGGTGISRFTPSTIRDFGAPVSASRSWAWRAEARLQPRPWLIAA